MPPKKKKRFNVKSVPRSFKLPIQTVTIVPSTKNKTQKITPAQFKARVMKTKRFLSQLFGGYTSVRGVGGFLLKGKVIQEKVAMVTSYSTRESFRKNKSKWITWARAKKKQWGQEAIGIIIENDLMYV